MKQHQATIKDIAKSLDISISTVSRALRDHPDIGADTKKMVQEKARELKYEPNLLALCLRKNKSNTIGLIIPEIVHHFFSSVISGIEKLAYQKGYNIIICQSDESYERERINAQTLLSNRVDGLLVSVSKNTKQVGHFQSFANQGVPVVFFDRICAEMTTDRVIVNDELGGFLATEHLIKIGCKKIAHFAAPSNLMIAQGRFAGYQRALRHYNIDYNVLMVKQCDTVHLAEEKTQELMRYFPETDGIFVVNDSTAIAVINVLKNIGKRVPEDVSVIGFGDGPIAELVCPKLTTIQQKGYEMGMEAVNLLIDKIENESSIDHFQTKVITPVLIVRDSTMPLK